MKISLISTVLNEEKNIRKFLDSIINQTQKPDEVIIVDGGSHDNTLVILKNYAKKHKWIKILQKKDSNISKGRNISIEKAKNEIIIGADAGTQYEKNWIEELIRGFNGNVGFGQTLPLIENEFQKILAKKMKQKFGSSRNIIFRKEIWEKIGGYPEDLDIAEDTVFNERVKKAGFKIGLIPKAIGYWEMRHNTEELKKQFYRYGYWDGVAYKKYRILPIKHKIVVVGVTLLFPLYPFFLLLSKFSLLIKIDFLRRFSYVTGFWKGLMNNNIINHIKIYKLIFY